MCYCLKVNRSSYYEWLNSKSSKSTLENEMISEKIRIIFTEGRQSYGTRRIKKALARQDLIVSRRRIGRLMKKMQLSCQSKRKFRVTTDSKHQLPISPNLLNREFTVNKPDTCYVGDITYIRTEQGWLYLAIVIDLFSRKVVGWAMAEHMKSELVNNALLMAIWQRKPAKGLI
jgi:transposase InsO family protein